MNRHWPAWTAFDNCNGSCEGKTIPGLPSIHEGCHSGPRCANSGDHLAASRKIQHICLARLDDRRMTAPSPRMILGVLYPEVVHFLRFLMTDDIIGLHL